MIWNESNTNKINSANLPWTWSNIIAPWDQCLIATSLEPPTTAAAHECFAIEIWPQHQYWMNKMIIMKWRQRDANNWGAINRFYKWTHHEILLCPKVLSEFGKACSKEQWKWQLLWCSPWSCNQSCSFKSAMTWIQKFNRQARCSSHLGIVDFAAAFAFSVYLFEKKRLRNEVVAHCPLFKSSSQFLPCS